ncbi:MAG: hypothetical protein AAF908_11430 [Pseudomonadota bacterium]
MKAITLITALALTLAPAMGYAQDTSQQSSQTGGAAQSGGVADDPLPLIFGSIGEDGALALGATAVVVGIIVGVMTLGDGDNDPAVLTTVSTN